MTTVTRTGTALLTVLLAAACSGGSSPAKEVAPTKATGTAAANAINLKKSDLPSGWTSTAADNSDNSKDETDKKLAACLGLQATDINDVVDLNSDDFSKGAPPSGVQVSSEVEVVASLAQAKRLQKGYSGDKAESCISTLFADEAKAEAGSTPGVTFGTPTVTKKSGPSGTDGSFGFTVQVPVKAQGASINVTSTIVGFFVKHTEVTLQSTSFGAGADFDADAVMKALVDRAKASAV